MGGCSRHRKQKKKNMVKKSDKRISKFEKKISGDRRKLLYDSQRKNMIDLEIRAEMDMEKIEIQIKRMAQGYPALHLPYYIIFAKEIYAKKRKFTGRTLINELEILDDKWEKRGLDPALLEEIKTYYVPEYKLFKPFRLDISLLDGIDILS